MKATVYNAIVSLCELKGKATYTEIAAVAEIKKQKAIDYVLRNKHLLKINTNGVINGFISHESNVIRIVTGMFFQGKIYKLEEINYGADKQIIVHAANFDKIKHLVTNYCVGGIGDNYMAKYIVYNDATKKAVEDLGFREFTEVVNEKIKNGEDKVFNDFCDP